MCSNTIELLKKKAFILVLVKRRFWNILQTSEWYFWTCLFWKLCTSPLKLYSTISKVSSKLSVFYERLRNFRSSHWRCSVKKVFLEIRPATLLKKRFCHRPFPVNFAKFLYRTALDDCFWNFFRTTTMNASVPYHMNVLCLHRKF